MAEMNKADGARRALVLRLKRIEGQLRGVQGMIEENSDCEAVAQQLSAARKALDKVFYELMACAIEHPQFAAQKGEKLDARTRRIARVMAKFG